MVLVFDGEFYLKIINIQISHGTNPSGAGRITLACFDLVQEICCLQWNMAYVQD